MKTTLIRLLILLITLLLCLYAFEFSVLLSWVIALTAVYVLEPVITEGLTKSA